MNFSPFLCVNRSCDETLEWSKQKLTEIGLRPLQTFYLHRFIPGHDTFDNQLMVLLVYDDTNKPETLIMYGNNTKTWLSIRDSLDSNATGSLVTVIKDLLTE